MKMCFRSHVMLFAGVSLVSGGCAVSHQRGERDGSFDPHVDAGHVVTCDARRIETVDAGSCIEAPRVGHSVTLSSELGPGDGVWHRPTGDSCPTELDTARCYYVETFRVCGTATSSNDLSITLVGLGSDASAALEDTFLTVYRGPSIPADAGDCWGVDDDGLRSDPPGGSELRHVAVRVPDGVITIAATTHANVTAGGVGRYVLEISGQ